MVFCIHFLKMGFDLIEEALMDIMCLKYFDW